MKHNVKWILVCMAIAVSVPAVGLADTAAAVQGTDSDAVLEARHIDAAGTEQAAAANAAALTAAASQPAADISGAAAWLEPAEGEWYDTKGELAMTVTANAINNCPIVGLSDMTYGYPRTGTFTVAEAAGTKTIQLQLLGHKSHQYLIINDRTPLRRSIHGDHYETIGNISLGMAKDDVLAAYGQPSAVSSDQGVQRWSYTAPHMDVLLRGNLVMAVRAYKDSDITFARSGLKASDTPEAYAAAYNLDTVPVIPAEEGTVSEGYALPQGETLYFAQEYVALSVF